MADAALQHVTAHAERVESGLWCDACALPSASSFKITLMCQHGVLSAGTVTACARHPRQLVTTRWRRDTDQ